MCYPIGARLAQRRILALDTLYHHLFSTPGCDATTIDQLKHDLVLWLTHHSFEELADALEYYLADPNSDLEGDLAHLTCLDPWGVQGVCPGLYDLLDTPRLDFLAAQLHLRDSTLPRPLLHRSRGPPTIRSEYVALQPHLTPSPPPDHLDVCRTNPSNLQHKSLSCAPSVRHPDSPHRLSIIPQVSRTVRPSHGQSVHHPDSPHHLSIIPQVSRTVRPSHGQSVCHPRPSVIQTVRTPSRNSVHDSSVHHPTHPSCATSVRPSVTIRLSVHYPTMSVRQSYTV